MSVYDAFICLAQYLLTLNIYKKITIILKWGNSLWQLSIFRNLLELRW